MMLLKLGFFVILLGFCSCGVIELTQKTFPTTFGDGDVWMIEFFAPWCPHCKSLEPIYKEVANNLDGAVKVASVDCDDEAAGNKYLAGQFGVKGFPTLKLFSKKYPKGLDYSGARTMESIVSFAVSQLPDNVVRINDNNIDEFFSGSEVRVVLFSAKIKPSLLYRALANEFANTVPCGFVTEKSADIMSEFNVQTPPKVAIFPTGKRDESPVFYDGPMKKDNLVSFVNRYLGGDDSAGEEEAAEPQEKKEATTRKPEPPKAVARPLDRPLLRMQEPKGMWFILHTREGIDAKTVEEFERAGRLSRGNKRIHFFTLKDAEEQPTWKQVFEISDSLLSDDQVFVLAVNTRRRKFASLVYRSEERLGDTPILDFVDRVVSGDLAFTKIDSGLLSDEGEGEWFYELLTAEDDAAEDAGDEEAETFDSDEL